MASPRSGEARPPNAPGVVFCELARYCDRVLMGELALEEIYGGDDRAFHADREAAYSRLRRRADLGVQLEVLVEAIALYLGEELPPPARHDGGFQTLGALTARAPAAVRLTLCLSSARAISAAPAGGPPDSPDERKRHWLSGARTALGAADRLHALRQDLDRSLRRVAVERLLTLGAVNASGLSFAATDLLAQYPDAIARSAVMIGRPSRNTVRLLQQRLQQLQPEGPRTNS